MTLLPNWCVRRPVILPFLLTALLVQSAGGAEVNESARRLPVAYEVDVVVLGGGTGAVAAATAAAEQGAKVFLAAERPYLGDDMTATLRLWLDEGETPASPLAQQIFADDLVPGGTPDPNRIRCSYEADLPSSPVHRDTNPPSRLTDGAWGIPSSQSVQYDGSVEIIADLGKSQAVAAARMMVFNRGGSGLRETLFRVESISVSSSNDKTNWKEVGSLNNKRREDECCITLELPVSATARYLKFQVSKSDDVDRILLGELEIIRPASEPTQDAPSGLQRPPRPMHVKRVLDNALLEAGVEFLYSCLPTDVLRDPQGNPCGIVMANRAGRQAVLAKVVIDATERAAVTRMAGARFRPFPGGVQTLRRTVIGGEIQSGPEMRARIAAVPYRGRHPNAAKTASGDFAVIEYALRLPLAGDTPAAWAQAEQQARTLTYHPEQQFTADNFFQVAADPMIGRESSTGPWGGAEAVPLDALRPAAVSRWYVLGGCADVSREQAEKLLRPLAQIDLGTRVGQAAAAEAKALPAVRDARLSGTPTDKPVAPGDVHEFLTGVRPVQDLPTVAQTARALPVFGKYDVVVVGGGTGGAPAGIGAARAGAKTLVVEYLHCLGGVGTTGAISKYYWGNRVGFTATIEGGHAWVIEQKQEWFRQELLKAGADIWFGTIGCGAFVEDGKVVGVVVVTPQGRGIVLADVVIDSTGNSDIAAAAGSDCLYTDETEFGMQGTGLPPRMLGATYTNTDFTITDETDVVDMWHLFVFAKDKYDQAFDQGQLIDTRERRRIVGDYTMTVLDQMNRRTYPDTITQAYSNFDTHGFTIHPFFMLNHPEHGGIRVNIPYRCLLPKGLRGILVTGLGISVHRDAVPLVRMQPDIHNQGYAAGTAAAMAVRQKVEPRQIDFRKLQEHLIEIGNLHESVLTDEDSYPLPVEKVVEAVGTVKDGFKGCAVILTQPEQALPLLREAYAAAEGKDKLTYARLLCTMGDATSLETVLAEIEKISEWDKGWNYQGMGQFGRAMSPLDELIVAAGRTGDRRAVPVILEKAEMLTPSHDFSHHRAVGLALELIGHPTAAQPLAELLGQPGISGYVHRTIEDARLQDGGKASGTNAVGTRRNSLRELMLARALYRCGDYNGVGEKTLRAYVEDLRGHLSRHADAILRSGKGEKPIF